jgi:hypothetical protein
VTRDRRERSGAAHERWLLVRPLLGTVAAALSGCAHFGLGYTHCDEPPPALLAALPSRLSETGLFADPARHELAANVRAYRPRYELWSDGATKRRWLELPEGQVIDTSDMDSWRFPAGTKLWKEFSVGGTRVETRLLEKVGPAEDDWSAAAYVWLPDGSDAVITPAGLKNALGTAHDVPAAAECFGCHGGRASRVLGVSAIQLADDGAPDERDPDEQDLDALAREGKLSDLPARDFTPPGDATAREALGFLHANCSHCHNQRRPARDGARCFEPEKPFDLSLYTTQLSAVVDTAAYRTTLDGILIPGDPEHSELYRRAESGSIFLRRMPPLATKVPDADALDALRAWIDGLPLRGP